MSGVFQWKDINQRVKETWARAVEWYFVKEKYGAGYANIIASSYFGDYTGFMRDVIDKDGFTGKRMLYEGVSGYTLRQVEDALKGSETFDEFSKKLELWYDNPTEKGINPLMKYWLYY